MRRFWLVLLVLLAGACSMRGAIDAMTSPEDRAFAESVVEHFRRGDAAWLRRHFHPDLWTQSQGQLAQVPAFYPHSGGETEIVSFHTSTVVADGRRERQRRFTLVTHGDGRWTVTSFETYSDGGPERIVRWHVAPHAQEPPELAMINAVERALPWIWGGLLVLLAAVGGLIFWLVRRGRRRRAAQTGTP